MSDTALEQLRALHRVARAAVAAVESSAAFRSDVTYHDYGGQGHPDGVHRGDCRWCALKRAVDA